MKIIYLKSALKSNCFDVSIYIKIPFSRVSVTIEPGRSLLTVRYHELFDPVSLSQIISGLRSQCEQKAPPTSSCSYGSVCLRLSMRNGYKVHYSRVRGTILPTLCSILFIAAFTFLPVFLNEPYTSTRPPYQTGFSDWYSMLPVL